MVTNFSSWPAVIGQRAKGFRLEEDRVRLDIRKKLFSVRVLRHWHKLPRKVETSLEMFKARLGGVLINLLV